MRKRFKNAIFGAVLVVSFCIGGFTACDSEKNGSVTDAPAAKQNELSAEQAGGFSLAKNGEYVVSAGQCVGGVIVPTVQKAVKNETVIADIYAGEGYRLKRVYANGVALNFSETSDFCYSVKALMPEKDLVFTAEFVENPVITDEYSFTLSAAYSQAMSRTAMSYWKASYTPTGLLFNVLVKDTNIVQNGRLAIEDRDFVEMRIAAKTTAQDLENANALRCLVTADGTFALQKCLGANDYAPSGYGVGYEYGTNFDTDSVICTLSKNQFEGYAVTAYIGYELFGLTAEQAIGNMTFAPALNNSLGTDGAKGVDGVVWNSTDIEMNAANAECFFGEKNVCEYGNPATWLGINADGSLANRYATAYAGAEYLFIGDDAFASEGFNAFVKSLPSGKACNIGMQDMRAKDFATQSALETVAAYAPQNIILCVGAEDLRGGASAYTTAGRIISLLQDYRNRLPQTSLYFVALLPNAESVTGVAAYAITNEQVAAFAQTVDWLTVIDGTNALTENGEFKPYLCENGAFTSEGEDAFIAQIATALSLETVNSEMFGDTDFGYTSVGWTVGKDQSTEAETLTLTGRSGNAEKYAYFKGEAVETFTASASFFATDVLNGSEAPQFGMVVASKTQRLYFYIQETYAEDEIVQKQLCYQRVENGIVMESGALAIGLYYTDGESVKLSVQKTQTGLELYVENYKAFTLTCELGAASVGIYTQDRAIGVTAAEIQKGGSVV